MKNVLVYIPSGLPSPELEILLSKTQNAIDGNKNVVIAICSGGDNYACSYNIYGLINVCHTCRSVRNRGLNLLKGSFSVVSSPENKPFKKMPTFITNRQSLKRYTYKKIDVGQASYSSYLGFSRDQNLDGFLWNFSIQKLLYTSKLLSDWFYQLIRTKSIDEVILYNGRQNQYRPLLRVCKILKIPALVMEFSGQNSNCVFEFKNVLPQDLKYLESYINNVYKSYNGDITSCANSYYKIKRSGGVINDTKSYILGQKMNFLPKTFDSSKHNIGIFNSSEDEFAALGDEYDKTLYPTQFIAISQICKALKSDEDIHIWLRVHPNLKSVKWNFSRNLFLLENKYSNVTIISADSKVSSYSLLDKCDTIVSFGSTMGVEASFANKPSILIARCIYEKLKSVYVPKSHNQLIELLRDKKLKPLSKIGAFKTAVFWSSGGASIPYFTGDRKTGFKFNGFLIKKNLIESIEYILFKSIEKIILDKLLNFYFSFFNELKGKKNVFKLD
jgi:hypothetical protein